MLNHSNKSKGFLPVKSGPNMTGFDMGKPQSLMEMMQTGGPTTRGGAALARAMQQQADIKKLEEAQRKEAKRQKRGGLFGSIGGLAGGLLGAALAPVTGGVSLAIASGLGTALGRRVGEGIGAGKSRSVDRTGTVFGQQSFRDVEKASRDFTRGMGERALVSGLGAALSAGLTPGGGLYGKTAQAAEAGKLGAFGTRLREGASAIGKAGARLGLGSGRALTTASGQLLSSGVPANIAGSALADTVLGEYGSSVVSPLSAFFLSQPLYNPVPQGFTGPLLDSGDFLSGMQDGGLLGMQTGGFTAESILESEGLDPTSNQLKLFQAFDPTGLQSTADTLMQQQVSAGQQSMQQQAGSGFAGAGGVEQTQSAISKAGQRAFDRAVSQEQARFASQTLGTAADLVAGGAEFGSFNAPDVEGAELSIDLEPGQEIPTVESLPSTDQGPVSFGGETYFYREPPPGSTLAIPAGYYTIQDYLSRVQSQISDIQLKENINFIGYSDSGLSVYTFEYKDKKYGEGVYQGVMAQEVPWASVKMDNGYLAVDYGKVDVNFKRVS